MGDTGGSVWTHHNVAAYSSPEAAGTYARNAEELGLVGGEEAVLRKYFTPPQGRLLDLGCGAGRTTHELDERGFDVVGVDVSDAMVRAATDLYPDLEVEVADAAALPFEDDRFEYALFSAYGLDYLHPESRRLEALEEVHRVLKPGGIFAFNTHNSWYALPAMVLARRYLRRLYLERGNLFRLGSPYKVSPHEFDVATYISNPARQRAQLRDCGFEFLECVGKRHPPVQYLERGPFYVARKPIR